jgi:DNA-binding NtrC family response regulator
VAAIVPFHPRSETAASWMLLGDRFSEEVYTPLDFKMVEELFGRMADLFLDKLLLMRTQLTDTQREVRSLHQRLNVASTELEETRKANETLREQNSQLMSQYAASVESSVLGDQNDIAPAPATPEVPASEDKTLDDYVEEFEARIIEQVLKRCDGNKAKAARLLGLRANTLHYKIERYGLSGKKDRD